MQSDRGNQPSLRATPPGAWCRPGRARYVHAGLEVGADRLLLSERAAIICCAVRPPGLLWRLLWLSVLLCLMILWEVVWREKRNYTKRQRKTALQNLLNLLNLLA